MNKFRCSSHKSIIEQGRYMNIERNWHTCKNCNSGMVEDEYQF